MSFHIFGLYPVGFLQTEFICTVTEVALLANLRAGYFKGFYCTESSVMYLDTYCKTGQFFE